MTIYIPVLVMILGAVLYLACADKAPKAAALALHAWWVGLLVTLMTIGTHSFRL